MGVLSMGSCYIHMVPALARPSLENKFPFDREAKMSSLRGRGLGVCLGYLIDCEFIVSADADAAIPLDNWHNGGSTIRE